MVDADIRTLKGVGDKTAQLLNKLGIYSINNLLDYYPVRYDIFSLPIEIKQITEGEVCAIECLISSRAEMIRTSRYIIVSLRVNDPSGTIRLVWYNSPFISKQLTVGSRFIFRGKAVRKGKELIIVQPSFYTREAYIRKLSELQPVYRLTKGITVNTISKLVKQAIPLIDRSSDYLTGTERKSLGLLKYADAVSMIHFPVSKEACIDAHKRLVFDEFVRFMVNVRLLRENRSVEENFYPVYDFSKVDILLHNLPYELTKAQLNVINEIKADLQGSGLMSRMIQGDVGSGKTIVAVAAVLACVSSGYQCCVMAPTDVLARQHYETFTNLLGKFDIRVTLLTGQMKLSEKKKAYDIIASHSTDVIIGTHALIQDSVEYAKLGLAVIDEQHRFGVNQREAIMKKGNHPHILAMSATPIPRSLAIILYGDLDLSIINEMPKNRLQIKNCVVGTGYRMTAYRFILNQLSIGHQAYIICPKVDSGEEYDDDGISNVTEYTEELNAAISDILNSDKSLSARFGHFPVIRFLHGRIKPAEKNAIMEDYKNGLIDILVSTTVIEVGVNVPNATVMMVENSERFGLAQLHQLRGRVGRGEAQSFCIFVKGIDNAETDERLNILVKYNDGMQVAEQDLKLRGPGDFFGTRQSGELAFKLADIYNDADILKVATDYVNGLDEVALSCFSRIQTNNWII